MRILFPSPAEVRFIELMGGKSVSIDFIKYPTTKFPLTFFITMGKVLRSENVVRERRIGGFYADLSFETPYTKKLIEIDGEAFHGKERIDIVREQQRDDYLRSYGWQVLHIRAGDLYRQPSQVQQRVMNFLAR